MTPTARKPLYAQLYVQVLVAVIAGVAVGAIFPAFGASLKPLGDAFVKLVKMIIAPVIFCTVVAGIGGLGDLGRLGRVGAKALGYFFTVSTLALATGLLVGNVVRPGAGLRIDPATLDAGAVADYATRAEATTVTGFLSDIIPDTAISAFTSDSILQALFVSLLTGIALAMLGDRGKPIHDGIKRLSELVFAIVHLVMKAAPIGAFGAMAFTIGKYGIGAIASLAALVATFYLTSLLFVLVVLGLIARANGFSILALIRYLKAELLLIVGTSSSESALPALIEKLEAAGVSPAVAGVVVPTGYSFNLDGTNIYMTLAALFIAQALGIHLSFGEQALLFGVAMLSSKGAAGVTGSGFVTLAATLAAVPSLPVAGLALILGVDRFMSECRALTNFVGNAVAALVVARWEGELDRDQLKSALAGGAPSAAA